MKSPSCGWRRCLFSVRPNANIVLETQTCVRNSYARIHFDSQGLLVTFSIDGQAQGVGARKYRRSEREAGSVAVDRRDRIIVRQNLWRRVMQVPDETVG